MSLNATRAAIKAKLTTDMPTVTWLDGRLGPHMAHKTQSMGAISTASSTELPGQQVTNHIIVIQLYLAMTPTENMTVSALANPGVIEDAVNTMMNSLSAIQVAPGSGASWFLQPVDVQYPSDPNGQQTRAEVSVQAYALSSFL